MTVAADAAVQTVRTNMQSAWNNPITQKDVEGAVGALKNLNASDTREAFSKLSDQELRTLAAEVNDQSFFGLGGLGQGAKTDFFNEMARDLDAPQLARMTQVFDRTTGRQTREDRLRSVDDIAAIGQAVGRHASDNVKVDFVRQLAGSSNDQSTVQTSLEDRLYDPQARAIAEVIGGLQNNPAAAEQALETLKPEQLRAVLNAGTNETIKVAGGMGGGGGARSVAMADFQAVMKAASNISDADTKARVFEQGVAEMKDLASRGYSAEAATARNSLTQLLTSDTNGVMREMTYNLETSNGNAFATYAKSMLNDGQAAKLGEIQAQLLTGNRTNSADPVARFESTETSPSGSQRQVNAEVAGYFAGAVSSAAGSITKDARQQAEYTTAVLKSALTVLDKSGVGGRAAGTAASVAKEWVQFPVRAAFDALVAGRINAADALAASMQPTRDLSTLPNGLPNTELASGSDARSAFQSTWAFVSLNAKP
jgi:hypothetical protein